MSLTYQKGGVTILPDGKVYRRGNIKYSNGDYYDGEIVDKRRQGKGVLIYANGDKYVGDFLKDLRHGFGVYTQVDDIIKGRWLQGRRYEGYWKEGLKHGRGLWVVGDGSSYEGEFKEDKFSGRGILSYANGDRYEGEFLRGLKDGHGKLVLACNDIYVGEFKTDKKHGRGEYKYADDGGFYSGEFKRDTMYGSGLRVYASGSRYDGEFVLGKREGKGVFSTFSGDTYVGKFLDNKYHDEGVITYAHGDRYEGRFLKGMFYGFGKYIYADGGFYEGEYLAVLNHYRNEVKFPNPNGKKHGHGVRVWANGNRYEGQWKDDLMEGEGKFEYLDGSEYTGTYHLGEKSGEGVQWYGAGNGTPYECPMKLRSLRGRIMNGVGRCCYKGNWQKGLWHGQGHFICADGTEYKGEFKRGIRHGIGKQTLIRDSERGKPYDGDEALTGFQKLELAVGGVDTLYRPYSYEGGFNDGAWEGVGTVTFCNDVKLQGNFKALPQGNGIPVGVVKFIFPDSNRTRQAEYSKIGQFVRWLKEENQIDDNRIEY